MVAIIALIVLASAIAPGAHTANVSGVDRFAYETSCVTDDTISSLYLEDQKLFGFADGTEHRAPSRRSLRGQCKTFPGDDDWPSEKEWKKLDNQLNGALISTVPAAAACYGNWGIYDAAKCAEIVQKSSDPYFHEADPTSNMWPNFQGRTCLPWNSPNGTCTLGGFPSYVVNVSTVAHIQHALNFARNKNVRLIVKNTGHDYLGKSLGAGALSIWTHHLKDIKFIKDYSSDSGYKGSAFKVGAGVIIREIYEAAHKEKVMVAGGICSTVGYTGGYLAGGGHTLLAGYYGMGADSVESFEVVTPDGRFVTASNTSNPDLFWALRGGGGSTFGVVTSATVRAHPSMPVITSTFTFETGGNITKEVFWQGLRKYFEMFPTFAEAHTYTYFSIWPTAPDGLRFEMEPFWALNHTIDSFNSLVSPWFTDMRRLGIKLTPNTTLHEAFYPAYNAIFGDEHVGSALTLPGNRLFPVGIWEDPQKFDHFFDVTKNFSIGGQAIVGYQQAPQNRLNVDNAVSSAWRHTQSFLIGAAVVENAENATQTQLQTAAKSLNQLLQPWRDVAPSSEFGGSYLNEANVMEPAWQASFYGTQYPRLLELKKKWDPKSLFYGATAVGSEEWEVRDGDWGTQTQNGRLCRV